MYDSEFMSNAYVIEVSRQGRFTKYKEDVTYYFHATIAKST